MIPTNICAEQFENIKNKRKSTKKKKKCIFIIWFLHEMVVNNQLMSARWNYNQLGTNRSNEYNINK